MRVRILPRPLPLSSTGNGHRRAKAGEAVQFRPGAWARGVTDSIHRFGRCGRGSTPRAPVFHAVPAGRARSGGLASEGCIGGASAGCAGSRQAAYAHGDLSHRAIAIRVLHAIHHCPEADDFPPSTAAADQGNRQTRAAQWDAVTDRIHRAGRGSLCRRDSGGPRRRGQAMDGAEGAGRNPSVPEGPTRDVRLGHRGGLGYGPGPRVPRRGGP